MGLNFNETKAELESLACFEKTRWQTEELETGVPWRNNQGLDGSEVTGTRHHVFKTIWEQSLDPLGTTRNAKSKTTSPDELSIDWKNWPPNIPLMPKGLKIPIKEVPNIDLRLSFSGRWEELVRGTNIVPINYADRKFFENLGGYLNLPKSLTFKVDPPSLLFLNTRAGQYYTTKLHVKNSGVISRKLRMIPPANPCFTITRTADPKDGVAPGNTLTLIVKYLPRTNESVTDVIVFHVEDDGALTVPLISSCVPDPILEVEEWNCGCCVVGIPRTAFFEIKNIGGEGRFWILSEEEFNNEFLECHIKYKRTLIKESTRELVRTHTKAIIADEDNVPNQFYPQPTLEEPIKKESKSKNIIGIGEASGIIKRERDSMDLDSNSDHPARHQVKKKRKVRPMTFTKCFRIQPSCFHLQRNQKIDIKVRYLPKDANFHYEKLAIMCENGEVRWIAVKGLGIERDSEKLVDVKAHWTGPPVDLPTDPRTKFIMDCGDLISGEIGIVKFTITNRSCIPLYFFWSVRPVLTNPEASPENAETTIMERFFESTIEDQEGNSFFTGEQTTKNDFESWVSLLPLTVNPAQGLMEKKQELTMTFKAQCPPIIGYHACIISLYVEQVDEESKHAVLQTLQGLDKEKLSVPISRVELQKHMQASPRSSASGVNFEEPGLGPGGSGKGGGRSAEEEEAQKSESLVKLFSSDDTETGEDESEDYVTMKESIEQVRTSLRSGGSIDRKKGETKGAPAAEIPEEAILPVAVARRVSSSKSALESEGKSSGNKSLSVKSGSDKTRMGEDDDGEEEEEGDDEEIMDSVMDLTAEEDGNQEQAEKAGSQRSIQSPPPPPPSEVEDLQGEGEAEQESEKRGSGSSRRSRHSIDRRESINLHFIQAGDNIELTHDRQMNQGHGVYEDLKNYTENVIPEFDLWPNREKMLTPVAEVEIWLHSVPLDVTFYPPFIIANGSVRTQAERLIKVRNGTKHVMTVSFENLESMPIPVTCHPSKFEVKPNEVFTFKIVIFFERFGEVQQHIKGMISLPFMSIPCALSAFLRCIGPFLEILNPTLNFGIVPLNSETMRTIALRNNGIRPVKWIARVAPENLSDENREISTNQTRIRDKRLIRVWPTWGLLESGETRGLNVYFCAELGGEMVTSVEVMVEDNPESVVSVPVYGTVELPSLVLENARIKYDANIFCHHPVQHSTCTIINPTGFNIPFIWECPIGVQCKLCVVSISPNHATIPAKSRMECSITVESLLGEEDPLILDNLYVPCCVEGMREPLILKIECRPPLPGM